MWWSMLERVFSRPIEVIWLPKDADHVYIEIGPNPAIRPGPRPGTNQPPDEATDE
jgi:hypothetical protein